SQSRRGLSAVAPAPAGAAEPIDSTSTERPVAVRSVEPRSKVPRQRTGTANGSVRRVPSIDDRTPPLRGGPTAGTAARRRGGRPSVELADVSTHRGPLRPSVPPFPGHL